MLIHDEFVFSNIYYYELFSSYDKNTTQKKFVCSMVSITQDHLLLAWDYR